MREVLELIITNIIGQDVHYDIFETETESGVEFVITLPQEQCGRLIGKGGQNIKSIRDVVNIIARRDERRVFIKIREAE